jgi:hypothetical protein
MKEKKGKKRRKGKIYFKMGKKIGWKTQMRKQEKKKKRVNFIF